MRQLLESFLAPSRRDGADIKRINALRAELAQLKDDKLEEVALKANERLPLIAATATIASRVLGENMFDVQLRGALALIRGDLAEMQTGEGKTLAAVPAVAWYARQGRGVHVMTVNDYLARRDAAWMGEIYTRLGLSVGYLQQGMTAEERRAAYACDITYATPNEIGFDFLRDRLALEVSEQVHRPFAAAVIDEVDSILIDEARVPLVIAGGGVDESVFAHAADPVVRSLRAGIHYTVDTGAHNVALTDSGIAVVESAFACGNLHELRNLNLLTAMQDALHAHALLRRDVDYVVKNGAIEMVDVFKGRIAQDRRWAAGLHTAIEVKEGVAPKAQGMILGSITFQHLIALYPRVCGMTGTAASSAVEFEKIYGLRVEKIPTNRPMVRADHPDVLFATKAEKERAVVEEIRPVDGTGQPVLVGTGSVEESERLSAMLGDTPHQVLNARNDENEARTIAEAGQRGAVTISTNMAGRGTDIRLGDEVAALGGLYVIGMQRHESRRIDEQLRGRAGRQGDPGCSRFFVSREDDLMVKYAEFGDDPESVQRRLEGEHLNQRIFLQAYELPVEGQRHRIHEYRQRVLEGKVESRSDERTGEAVVRGSNERTGEAVVRGSDERTGEAVVRGSDERTGEAVVRGSDERTGEAVVRGSELRRLVTLRTIDDLWADYLARLANFRAGLPWLAWGLAKAPYLSLGGRDPYYEYAQKIHKWFPELESALPGEIARRIAEAEAGQGSDPGDRGAIWTYLTTDQPFGTWSERMRRGFRRRHEK